MFSDDAFDAVDDGKSECDLPDSVIENWIKRGKGKQFYDSDEDQLLFLNKGTVIEADYSPESGTWEVSSVYRKNLHLNDGSKRFSKVSPEDFKKSRRENQ